MHGSLHIHEGKGQFQNKVGILRVLRAGTEYVKIKYNKGATK